MEGPRSGVALALETEECGQVWCNWQSMASASFTFEVADRGPAQGHLLVDASCESLLCAVLLNNHLQYPHYPNPLRTEGFRLSPLSRLRHIVPRLVAVCAGICIFEGVSWSEEVRLLFWDFVSLLSTRYQA